MGVKKSCFSLRKSQLTFLCILSSCVAMVLIFTIFYSNVEIEGKEKASQTSQVHRPRKLFLLWTKYFGSTDWLPSTSDLNCPVQECDVTSQRSLLANSSAVVMHWRNLDPDDLPECVQQNKTSVQQCPRMVLFNKEAPPNTPRILIDRLHDSIHVRVTYRRDSEVYAPYGNIKRRNDVFKMPDLSPNRSMVCWLVSHCYTPSTREIYVNQLKRHIDVQVYGKCGTKSCPHENVLDCYRWLSERCKFYLSFENSICKDYATEKLYYAMMTDMVPVVLGGDDYARYLPSNSFIDVADFSSPKALAEYLNELKLDESRYLSYFKWKQYYTATFVPFSWFCDLCEFVHRTAENKLKPYRDIRTWWFDDGNCGSLAKRGA